MSADARCGSLSLAGGSKAEGFLPLWGRFSPKMPKHPFLARYIAAYASSLARYKVRLGSFQQKKKINEGNGDAYENPDCLQ
ncbi:hypothetical protein NKH36_30440 [Mesorhizobium sp. M1312]|uniref:hypothetical protein n=1 Tax=unclassified Mesorhizobium TaxID=325217 RepID=UPI0033399170